MIFGVAKGNPNLDIKGARVQNLDIKGARVHKNCPLRGKSGPKSLSSQGYYVYFEARRPMYWSAIIATVFSFVRKDYEAYH